MRDVLPVIPIPLAGEDPPAQVALQPCFNRAFDEARYEEEVDYDNPPTDPHLKFFWYAIRQGGDTDPLIEPGTGDEFYKVWITFDVGFYTVTMRACPSDGTTGRAPCTS